MIWTADDVMVEECPSGWHAWTAAKQRHGFGSTREAALEQLAQFLVLQRRLAKRVEEYHAVEVRAAALNVIGPLGQEKETAASKEQDSLGGSQAGTPGGVSEGETGGTIEAD